MGSTQRQCPRKTFHHLCKEILLAIANYLTCRWWNCVAKCQNRVPVWMGSRFLCKMGQDLGLKIVAKIVGSVRPPLLSKLKTTLKLVTAHFLPGIPDANLCKNKQKQTNMTNTMFLCLHVPSPIWNNSVRAQFLPGILHANLCKNKQRNNKLTN